MGKSFIRWSIGAVAFVPALLASAAASAEAPANAPWPQFRGPERTGVSRETGLLKQWPEGGPALIWKVTGVGEGMGGLAISRGRIYTTGDRDGSAWLFALNETDGKPAWEAKIGRGGKLGNVFRPSGPRATPTVDGDRIYIVSQHGDLVCFTTEGKEVWRKDFIKDFGGINPVWGFSESVLVDGDKLVCTPGGADAVVMALDKKTGNPIWKCAVPEGPTGDRGFLGTSGAAYASIIPVDFEGQRQYIQLTATTMVGVGAADGKLLWRWDRPSNTHRINCFTPIYHDGLVFASTAYDAGGGAAKLSKGADGAITATEVHFSPRIKQQHGGMVLVDGYLYGILESGLLNCINMITGEVAWQARLFGKGSVTYADGRLYCRAEGSGAVALVVANPKQYVELGRFEQPGRTSEPAWTQPVVANGRLYIRDQDTLLAYNVKAASTRSCRIEERARSLDALLLLALLSAVSPAVLERIAAQA
jgi:outer membrane protein assembly factor BamB